MKRIICGLILVSIFLFPMPTLADTQLSSIKYDDINTEIMNRNPTVKVNLNTISSANYGFDLQVMKIVNQLDTSKIQNSINSLNQQLLPLQTQLATAEASGTQSTIDNLVIQIGNISSQVNALTMQKQAIELQANSMDNWYYDLDTNRNQTIQKLTLSLSMANDSQVWVAENYYLSYNSLLQNKQDILNTLNYLTIQQKAIQLKRNLGLATDIDLRSIQSNIIDQNQLLNTVVKNMDSVKSQMALLFNQPFDTTLNIDTVPSLNISSIDKIDYKKDLDLALANSYTVQMEKNALWSKDTALEQAEKKGTGSTEYQQAKVDFDSEQVKVIDETEKYKMVFDQAYNDLLEKRVLFDTQKAKLIDETTKYNYAKMNFDLGLISQIEFSGAFIAYQAQSSKVNQAEQDLFKAYEAYKWTLKGLSTNQGSSSQPNNIN